MQPVLPPAYNTGRRAEFKDILRYLKRRSDDYREANPGARLILRDLIDELATGRHRKINE